MRNGAAASTGGRRPRGWSSEALATVARLRADPRQSCAGSSADSAYITARRTIGAAVRAGDAVSSTVRLDGNGFKAADRQHRRRRVNPNRVPDGGPGPDTGTWISAAQVAELVSR